MKKKDKKVLITVIDTYKAAIDLFFKGSWSDEELTLLQLIDALIELAHIFISEKEPLEVIDTLLKAAGDMDKLLDEWWEDNEDIHLPAEAERITKKIELLKSKIEKL